MKNEILKYLSMIILKQGKRSHMALYYKHNTLSRKHSQGVLFFRVNANSQGKKNFGLCGLAMIKKKKSEKDTLNKIFFLLPLTDKSIWFSVSWGAWHLINAGCIELKWYQSGGKHLIFISIRHSYTKSYFKRIHLTCYALIML